MLKARISTSIILLVGFLAALFLLPDVYWATLMLMGVLIGVWEWAAMAGFLPAGRIVYTSITMLMGLAIIFAPAINMSYLQHYGMFWGILAAAVFWIVLAPVWLILRYQIKSLYVMAITGWVVILPLWLALTSLRRISPWLLLGVIGAVWIADSAAYFTGKRFGKRKLAPLISPGKTWEGVLGAWLAVTVYGFVLCQLFALDYWMITGLWGITVLSIMGDLLESLLKRHANIKDSGSLLPGHGGVLDRIDGLTSSLPLTAFFIYFPLYYAAWFYYV